MPERRTELITEGNAKKQAISVIIVAILLFGLYLGSTALIGFIFGIRTTPSDELTNALDEEAELFDIAFDMFNLMDLLNYEDLLEHAEEAVFYIEDYDYFDESWLWKFSVMDEYNNDGSWSQSVSGVSPATFTSWNDYYNDYSDRDMIRIKYPIDATTGENSLIIPSLFPTPHIMDRPWLTPGADWFDPQSSILYKDLFNVASINLNFNSDYSGNLTYDLFGESVLSPTEINNSAVMEIYTPSSIKDQYYQLPDPGGIPGYIQNNPNFKSHYDALDVIIDYTDNAYVKADKIRNYLQQNFEIDFLPPYNRPAQGEDVVEWFCGTQSGIFSDFAATYTALTRAFGIASRYVDGFNSRYTEESYNQWEGKNYYTIKRLNLYSWSEIYVPLAIDGSGVWTEMDILFEGQNRLTFEEMELIVYTNTISPVIRGDDIEIIAELYLNGIPQEGEVINFEDITENDPNLGQSITDSDGSCSIIINIDTNTVAGPHLIQASKEIIVNYTNYFLDAPIEVNLDSVLPNYIDKTISSNTNITGDLIDPANGKGVSDGEVEFILLDSLNNKNSFAFVPDSEITDNNGEYNVDVRVNDHVISGTYNVRVDFNGSFNVYVPLLGFSYPFYYPIINDSSLPISIDIFNPSATFLDFYIEGYPNDDFQNPIVNAYDWIELKAELHTVSGTPLTGEYITFYDITGDLYNDPIIINSVPTDFNGEAYYWYDLGNYSTVAGPHLICAEWGTLRNHSYFIVDESVRIDLNPPKPVPNIINRTGSGSTTFNIKGSIVDDGYNDPIKHAEITVYLIRNNIEYFMELQPLNPSTNPYYCGEDGTFDLNFDVDNNISPGNYTIRVDFNGTFYYLNQDYDYPHNFFLTYINTSTSTVMDLKIEAPDIQILDFWINGTSTSEFEQPIVKRTQELNLKVNLQGGSGPLEGESVRFFDETNNSEIGVKITDENGYANITYYFNTGNLLAGPHLVYAEWEWGSLKNHSYFIIDEAIRIDLNPPKPVPNIINRSGSVGTIFNIKGSIVDDFYNRHIKYAEITVNLIKNNYKYNTQLIPIYPSTNPYYCGADGTFDLNFEVSDTIPAGNYSIRADFNGTFYYLNQDYDYPHDFFLIYINTSTSAVMDLEIKDPYNITIKLEINGSETQSFYDNDNCPQSFMRSDYVNFTVRVIKYPIPVGSDIYLYDVYENRFWVNQTNANGIAEFILHINDSWVVGPHKIKVLYQSDGYDFPNYTFIIVNGSKMVEISVDKNNVTRNLNWITISGSVKDMFPDPDIKLKQVEVNIRLFNKITMVDNTNYLIIDWGQSYVLTTNGNSWNYKFYFKLNISTPPGEYYARVDFNGSIRDYSGPIFIDLSNYMISNSSELKILNVFATVTIDGNYHTDIEGEWYDGDIIQIYGTMYYDNGSAVKYEQVNCTLEDSIGTVYDWNDTEQTNEFGYFYAEIVFQYIWENPEKIFAISLVNQNFIIDIRVELQWE